MFTIRIAKQKIIQLIADLRANGYDPIRAILFGSVAKGKAHKYSDIDVAIWDEKFRGCTPIDYECIIKIFKKISTVGIAHLSGKGNEGRQSIHWRN